MSWRITPSFTQWTPALITTALWLDAADASTVTGTSNVTAWADKSGNNRNATATTGPSLIAAGLNNKNFLRFDSNSQQFNISYAWPSTQTVYLVTASNAVTIAEISAIYGHTNPGFFGATTIQTHNVFNSNTQRRILFEIQSGASSVYTRIDGSSAFFKNISIYEFSIAGAAISNAPQPGKNVSIPSPYFTNYKSDLAEIIVLASIASTEVCEKIEGYLAHKWGLTANLPSNHPCKVIPPAP